MSNVKHTITDSEYSIMKILWGSENKMTVSDVVKALDGNNWTPSTVSTFLQRLLKKNVILCEKKGNTNLYYPILKQNDYDMSETESFYGWYIFPVAKFPIIICVWYFCTS